VYISLGHSHRQFLYDLVARPIVILGFFVGIKWDGLNGLVIAYGALSLLLLIPGFAFAIRDTFVRPSDIAAPLIRPAVMAVLASAASFTLSRVVQTPTAFLEVAVGVAGALIVISPLFLLKGYRADVALFVGFVRRMRGKKSTPST
jgi:PST family polysaccharide transporter